MMLTDPTGANGNLQAAGGYGPPGGGGYGGPPGGGGGYGGPPGGGGYGGPPGGGGYGGPPGGGGPPGYGGPPGGGGFGGPPGGPMGGPPPGGGFGGPGGFGPPGGGFPPPGGPMMPGAGGDANMTLPMVLNGVGFFLCSPSCLASILFLVGFIFAMQGNTMKNQGDIGGAMAKRKTAMLMAYIGGGLGLLGYIFIIISQAMR